ncbi:MAG TPA: patatin-like phospholipase family protein [Solirubrobacteraceae bacterium]|nr:patatin-like phospholipase family protein [Solirubrobacteraceae bacterium]
MTPIALLRNVPVLAGLSDELLEALAHQLVELRVRAGEWIMREGEVAESAFIVVGGRVEVLDERPPETLIRVLRRGDVLGELALLREGTRSASARAHRDTELLELARTGFEGLIQQAPSFALGLTRAMGAQLAASRTPVAAAPPRTIAVVGLDRGAPVAQTADEVADVLGMHGTVARLNMGGLAAIDQAERDADRVVLCGGVEPEDPWTRICTHESDLVIALTSGAPARPWLERAPALRGCELVVFGPGVASEAIARLQPREVQVIAQSSMARPALQATARRLAGRSLGLVLSGGGARALAHLGALEELAAAGLRFDRVAGVSLGSLVAATAAMGLTPAEVYETFERSFRATNPTRDFTVPAFSLLRGTRVRRLLDEVFGERRIEELPLRFFCLSCDLVEREPVLHRTGRVVDAVYPSFAIPGVFPPVARADGRLLVDGGVLDNLPVATMARSGEGPVIAVDVTGGIGRFQNTSRPRLARLARPVRRLLTGSEAQVPGLAETMLRTLTVGSVDTVAAARLHAALVITPSVDGIGLTEWGAISRVRELGRAAVREALAADPDLPAALGV